VASSQASRVRPPLRERERRKQTATSSTPVNRAAKPSAPDSEKKRKTDHRSLASKHVWVLNAATQVRNAIETTAEWSWANTKQFLGRLDAVLHEEEQAQDDFSRDYRMQSEDGIREKYGEEADALIAQNARVFEPIIEKVQAETERLQSLNRKFHQ